MTRASSSRSVIAWSVSSPGTSWSKRRSAPLGRCGRRHDEHAHGARLGAVAAATARIARHLGRRLAGEVLEVLRRDRAAAGAQPDRPADLGVLDVLAVDAAARRPGGSRPGRRTGSTTSARSATCAATLPSPAAAGAVRRASGAGRPWPAPRRTGGSCRRPRGPPGPGGSRRPLSVEHEVPVGRGRAREVRDLGPLLPALVAGDLEHRRRVARDDGAALEREPLAGHALGDAERPRPGRARRSPPRPCRRS